jgi:Zn-dependent peptidase ImmA (M78 family)
VETTVPKSSREVHLIAARAAERAFRDLGIDPTRRIDPFGALEAEGVLVMRQPLDRLAGLYLPATATGDGRAGVLINVQHPPSKQRFTAAHELAHHRLDRQAVLDEDTELLPRALSVNDDRERIAESFAGWFLMPRQLVSTTMQRLALVPERLDAEGAYALSLEFGTSYTATVRHLADMRLLTSSQRDALLRVEPKEIKRGLGALDAVDDAWKDVWRIRALSPDQEIRASEGDAVWVEMPETPSSGYLWQVVSLADGLSLVREEYNGSNNAGALGGRGFHRFLFRILAAGRQQLHLALHRPWLAAREPPAEEHRIEIAASAKPAKGIVQPEQLLSVA